MRSTLCLAAVVAGVAWTMPLLAQEPLPVVVASAEAGSGGETVVITGSRFGRRPLVTLDLIPLTVQFANDSQIVAAAPTRMMPAGEYLLTVSRGTAPGDSTSVLLRLGAVETPADAAASATPADVLRPPAATDPAARVGERTITVEEVDREWQRRDPAGYLAMNRALYEARRRVVDDLVSDELIGREAAARKTSPEALLAEEIPQRVVPLPESAVASLYQSLGDATRGASLEQMRPALRAWLERNTEREMARMHFVEELTRVSTRADVVLEAPRVNVPTSSLDQSLGPATAPVSIVAFGDFYSLEYLRFASAFARVREHYGDRVRIVFKHLPMTVVESVTASEAAACAGDQGRFWPYHDAVVAAAGALSPARLKEIAGQAGLDGAGFDACLDGRKFGEAVRQAVAEAGRYAVASSPSFLVNGRLAPAAPPFLPPFEYFTRLIEEELLRQSQAARSR